MKARNPWHISDVLVELMARYDYTRQQWTATLEKAWKEAVGPTFASATRIGRLRRGVLEVVVKHSALVQELAFQKEDLLQTLQHLLPDQPIHDLRFRLGPVG